MSEKDYDTSPQPVAGRDQQTALEEGLDRLVAAGLSRSDAQQMIDQYQREYRAIWGEPQDWVIDRHDVAGMIDRRADEQLRLQQHRGQQTIGITDGIQGADSTGPDIEAINRAAEQAEATSDWAKAWRDELDSNRSAPEIADEQVSREWASQSQPADGERVHPSSEHYWSAAQNEIVTDSALLDQDEEVIDLSPAAEEPAWLPPPRAVADPVEDETARRAQLSQWHADDQAAETSRIEGVRDR